MKYRVTFNEENCKSCEICVEWCGKKLIIIDEQRLNRAGVHPAAIRDQDGCVGCLACAIMCPDAVITIEKISEQDSCVKKVNQQAE